MHILHSNITVAKATGNVMAQSMERRVILGGEWDG
jgi:hypothetical protein